MTASTIRSGIIFDIATGAGLEIHGSSDKRTCRCPFHPDRNASAFLRGSLNCFCCSVCGSLSAKNFASRLNAPWNPASYMDPAPSSRPAPRPAPRPAAPRPGRDAGGEVFGPDDALAVWTGALARTKSEDRIEADVDAYRYLHRRGLADAWEMDLVAIFGPRVRALDSIRWWTLAGYRLIAPLWDIEGRVVNVQARSITGRTPKTLNPKGSTVAGTVFSNAPGLELLRGTWTGEQVILGEGLTDSLALSIAAPGIPVFAAPGVGPADRAIGSWAAGRRVFVALDGDEAGEKVVPAVAQAIARWGGRPIRMRWPDPCKDANDALLAMGLDQFADGIETAMRGGRP